jgi:hypothetical protein
VGPPRMSLFPLSAFPFVVPRLALEVVVPQRRIENCQLGAMSWSARIRAGGSARFLNPAAAHEADCEGQEAMLSVVAVRHPDPVPAWPTGRLASLPMIADMCRWWASTIDVEVG